MANKKRMMIYGLVAVVAVVGFIATSPPKDAGKSSLDEATSAPRTPSSKKSTKETVFTVDDQKASYARLNEPVRNSFKPLVIKQMGSGGQLLANQVPPFYAGGSASWFYTGTAILNEVPMALVEDTSNGQGEYLQVAQTAKQARVVKITPSSLVLAGPDGETVTLVLIENKPIVEDAAVAPFNPLSGPIGIRPQNGRSTNIDNGTVAGNRSPATDLTRENNIADTNN